jgi:hypothetical protein
MQQAIQEKMNLLGPQAHRHQIAVVAGTDK